MRSPAEGPDVKSETTKSPDTWKFREPSRASCNVSLATPLTGEPRSVFAVTLSRPSIDYATRVGQFTTTIGRVTTKNIYHHLAFQKHYREGKFFTPRVSTNRRHEYIREI